MGEGHMNCRLSPSITTRRKTIVLYCFSPSFNLDSISPYYSKGLMLTTEKPEGRKEGWKKEVRRAPENSLAFLPSRDGWAPPPTRSGMKQPQVRRLDPLHSKLEAPAHRLPSMTSPLTRADDPSRFEAGILLNLF